MNKNQRAKDILKLVKQQNSLNDLDIEKDIYRISIEDLDSYDNMDFLFNSFFKKSKMVLSCEKLDIKWYLNPRRGIYDNVPCVRSFTMGIYAFWFEYNKKYYPLEVGSGQLSKRIPTKYYKLNQDVPHLFISFKRVDKDELLKIEKDYIEKLNPIFNKHHNDTLSKQYMKNLKTFHNYKNIFKKAEKEYWKKENLKKKIVEKKDEEKLVASFREAWNL